MPDLLELITQDISELENQLTNEEPDEDEDIRDDRDLERREQEVKDNKRESTDISNKDACEYCKNIYQV